MLLMLVHPAGERDDDEGKRIQDRVHCRRITGATLLMISIRLSFCTLREAVTAPGSFINYNEGFVLDGEIPLDIEELEEVVAPGVSTNHTRLLCLTMTSN